MDRNCFRGMGDADRYAVLAELQTVASIGAASEAAYNTALATALDGLTDASAHAILDKVCRRLMRASGG